MSAHDGRNRTLAPRGFARSVATVAGGAAVGQAVAFAVVPLLTRKYGPAAFGVSSVYVAVVSVVLPVLSLRYDVAISVAPREEHRPPLLRLSLLITVATSLLALLLAGGLYASPLALPPVLLTLRPYVWLLPLSLLGAGASQALTAMAVSSRRFDVTSRSRIVQSATQALSQLLGGFLSLGAVGLLIGDAIGRVLGAAALLTGRGKPREPSETQATLRAVAAEYKRFPLISSYSAVLNSAGLFIPPIVFTMMCGEQAGGWVGLSSRVASIPMGLVGTAVAQVYVGHAAGLVAKAPSEAFELYRSVRRRLLWVGLLPVAVLLVGGATLFRWVFGEQWGEAGVYSQLFAPMLLLQFVASPLAHTLAFLNRLHLQAWLDAARFAAVLAIQGLAYALHWTPRSMVLGMSIVTACAYAAMLLLSDGAFRQLCRDAGRRLDK